jgi:hypothetical protein
MELLWLLFVPVESYVYKDKNKHLDVWRELPLLYQVVWLEESRPTTKKIDFVKA